MVKTGSKFRHILINKKKYFFYEIKWLDVYGESGHADFKEFEAMQPALMMTNAYIFKKTKSLVWTFSSYDERDEVFSDRNIFPIGVIKVMKRIEHS